MGVIVGAGALRDVVVGEVSLLGRRVAVPRLQLADDMSGLRGPVAGLGRLLVNEVFEGWMGIPKGHPRVPRQHVVEGAHVRGPLDVAVATKGDDTPSRATHVPQDKLQHAEGADLLHPIGGLVELQGVGDGPRLVRPAGRTEEVGHLKELCLGQAADPLHHLRGIAAVVALQELEDAVGVLQGRIALHVAVGVKLVLPTGLVVAPLGRLVPGEQATQVSRGLEVGVDQERGVRVRHDIVMEVLLVLDGVGDQPTEEHDVGPGADWRPDVGRGRRAREPRIHVDDLRPPLFRLHDPLVAHRVALRPVGSRHDHVSVHDVDQVRGHGATAEGGAQGRDGGGVADPGGVLQVNDPQRPGQLGDEIVLLVVQHRGAHQRQAVAAIDRDALLPFHKGRIARLLDQLGDAIHHPVEWLLLPFVAARSPVERLGDPGLVDRELKGRGTLRAEGAFSMRAVGVALDVDDLVVGHIDELGAAHGAVGADPRDHLGVLDAERGGGCLHRLQVKAEASQSREGSAGRRAPRYFQKFAP